jgi:hypothetical protein
MVAWTVQVLEQKNLTTQNRSTKEDTMTAQVKTKTGTQVEVGQESAKYMVGAISVLSALIGIWAAACLISGFLQSGPGGLVKGYISALTGM